MDKKTKNFDEGLESLIKLGLVKKTKKNAVITDEAANGICEGIMEIGYRDPCFAINSPNQELLDASILLTVSSRKPHIEEDELVKCCSVFSLIVPEKEKLFKIINELKTEFKKDYYKSRVEIV